MHLRKAKVAVAAIGVVGMITFGATLASANDGGDGGEHGDHGDGGEETLPAPSLSPSSGPPGTEFAVDGTECFESDEIQLKLFYGEERLDADNPGVSEGGTWRGHLTVPDRDDLVGQELTVFARCNPVYDPAVFTVTERPQPPTTPPPPPPGGGGPPVTPAPPAPPSGGVVPAGGQQPAAPSAPQPSPAAPAAPVSGQPSFTG